MEIFKDAVAVMFLLEVDAWLCEALHLRQLGLSEESFVIDIRKDEESKIYCPNRFNLTFDEIVTFFGYGSLLVMRSAVCGYALYNAYYGTYVAGNTGKNAIQGNAPA